MNENPAATAQVWCGLRTHPPIGHSVRCSLRTHPPIGHSLPRAADPSAQVWCGLRTHPPIGQAFSRTANPVDAVEAADASGRKPLNSATDRCRPVEAADASGRKPLNSAIDRCLPVWYLYPPIGHSARPQSPPIGQLVQTRTFSYPHPTNPTAHQTPTNITEKERRET